MARWCLLLAVMIIVPLPTIAAELPTSSEVKSGAQKAVGFESFQKLADGIASAGKAEFLGITGTFRCRLAPDGRYVRTIEAKGEQAVGFDGKSRWGRNFSSPIRILELEEGDRDRYLFGILCQRWLAADSGFSITVDASDTSNEWVSLILTHPDAGVPARLYLDRATYLPARLCVRGVTSTRIIDFSEYRDVAGVRMPRRVTIDPDAGGQWMVAETLSVCAPSTGDEYAPPAVGPAAKFEPGAPAAVEARRMDRGRLLLVRPSVNGKTGPWFIFDTGNGALTMMTPGAADGLGLPVFGRTNLSGKGRVPSRFRQVGSFSLGPVLITDMVVAEMPQDYATAVSQHSGVEVAGIVGWDFLFRVVAQVNYQTGSIEVHDPTRYQLPTSGKWENVYFNARTPCVKGTLEGKHTGLFVLDTGQEARLALHAPAVQRLDLLRDRETAPDRVTGVGRDVIVRRGIVSEFDILGMKIKPLAAQFATEAIGVDSDPYTFGTIGLAALGPGVVVFDYPNRRIAFLPRQ